MVESATTTTVRRLLNIPELPSAYADDFEWPTLTKTAAIQE